MSSADVDVIIPIPGDEDNYNLVLDLTAMRIGIENAFDDVIAELENRPEEGEAANFYSVTCVSTGIFGSSVTVNSLSGEPALVMNNNASGFGWTRGAVSFKYNGSKFVASHAIQGVDGSNPADLTTKGYVDNLVVYLEGQDNLIRADAVALDARKVDIWNGDKSWAPAANYANSAGYAGSAGTAGSASSATNAGHADTADLINGRRIVTGKSGNFSTPGGADQNKVVAFGTTFTSPPTVVYSITEDNGKQSMLSSIDTITTTGFTVNVTNSNNSQAETYKIIWIAIGT